MTRDSESDTPGAFARVLELHALQAYQKLPQHACMYVRTYVCMYVCVYVWNMRYSVLLRGLGLIDR